MGRDKALLPWRETDLLGHAIARLRAVTPDVVILSGSEPRYGDRGLAVLTDRGDGDGPIAGLDAGLEHAGDRPVLLLAVDLPLVPVALLGWLAESLDGADAVVPVSVRGPEPLSAAYDPACLPAIRARVAAGVRRMTAFWPDVRVREVQATELRRFGDPETMFLNVNEPVDLQRAVTLSALTGTACGLSRRFLGRGGESRGDPRGPARRVIERSSLEQDDGEFEEAVTDAAQGSGVVQAAGTHGLVEPCVVGIVQRGIPRPVVHRVSQSGIARVAHLDDAAAAALLRDGCAATRGPQQGVVS